MMSIQQRIALSLLYPILTGFVILNIFVEGNTKLIFVSVNGGNANMDYEHLRDNERNSTNRQRHVDIVFSDLDGTLIHYPDDIDNIAKRAPHRDIITLPPSSTGMVGILSSKTIRLVRDIRDTGTKVVFVSGMRTSTLIKRLPYLPKADAYCCESGGRIFYPVQQQQQDGPKIHPKKFVGAHGRDLESFSLVEDLEWRKRMELPDAAGKDGYGATEIDSMHHGSSRSVPIFERAGKVWTFAQFLIEQGFVLDEKGYSTCFRVNHKHQHNSSLFDALNNNQIDLPFGLTKNSNLGCVDIYPSSSGKKNCCLYLAQKFGFHSDSVANRCVCLCDDDNDLEMALACLHAYIPQITSKSMEETIRKNPKQFTLTTGSTSIDGVCTDATENALELVLERISSNKSNK